jgi:hypothetical protein
MGDENALAVDELALLRRVYYAIIGASPMVGPFLFLRQPDAHTHPHVAAVGLAQFLYAALAIHDAIDGRAAIEALPFIFAAIFQAFVTDFPFTRQEVKISDALAGDYAFACRRIVSVYWGFHDFSCASGKRGQECGGQ